ncbi:MAG TPA: TonB-dependent receptor [Crocinitomix sp.]|nr:TonB-dependent receptor [Crocinitomix sp.]
MKKTKKIVLLLCLLTLTSIVNAQITVTGKVVDNTNVPIEFANVILLNKENSEIIIGTITDKKGNYTIKTDKKGEFNLQISFVGFEDYLKSINSTIDLGNIILTSNNELTEVVVTARKKIIEHKAGKLIFNVQNTPFLKGSDGIEVLKRTPRINTNNEQISILGKDNVRIMINDRITTLSGAELNAYLQSLTTKDITKIEVITNPSAKYSAEGNTGIINIVLNKQQADYYSTSIRAIYKPATYNAGEITGSYNFKKDKWLFSSSINRAKGFREFLENSTINYPTQNWIYDNKGKREFNNISGRLTLDYDFSKKTSIGIQYSGGVFKYPSISNSKTKIFNTQNSLDSTLVNHNNSYNKNYSHSINTHFQTKLDTLGKKLSVDLDYYKFNKNEDDLFESSSPNIYQSKDNKGVNNIHNLSGRLDFELPLKFAELETGIKISTVKNNSNIKNYNIINNTPIFNSNESNEFEYTENNQAIYFNANKKINDKWETQIGLRLEATQTKGVSITLNETTKNDYLKLFPTFYLNYEANKNNSFSFDYGKRIKRPSFFYLNPFRSNSDIYTYTEGNPLLKPSFIDNIEISHSYKNLLQTAIYYKKVENGFSQITILHPNNVQQIIPENYFNSTEFGLTENISFNITRFWETSNDIYLYYLKATATIPEVKAENKGFTAFLETDNTFILNTKKTIFATLNYWYQFPEASDLDNANAYSQLDIGIKALLLNKKIILNLSVSDILKTSRTTYTSYNGSNIKTTFSNYNDNRRLNFSVTYRFGNNKIRGKNHRGSNSEEKNRTN